ncbi:MAG: hypothetical protein SFT92_03235 [Rickettsiales bacterium]|nr:hypothetical protein [Rickettsiales bacterium]
MTNTDPAAPNLSRPKVHRLPKSVVAPDVTYATRLSKQRRKRSFIYASSVVASVAVVVLLFDGFTSLLSQQVASRGILQPIAAIASDKQKSIVINGESHGIVGQMAKMPTDQQGEIRGIETMSELDRDANRELLSIVSKY